MCVYVNNGKFGFFFIDHNTVLKKMQKLHSKKGKSDKNGTKSDKNDIKK